MVKKNPNKPASAFAQVVRALLEERGLSVQEASRLADIPRTSLSSWLRGHAPTDFAAVQRLARILGSTVSFVLTGEHDDPKMTVAQVADVFENKGLLFDGYVKIRIDHMVPRRTPKTEK